MQSVHTPLKLAQLRWTRHVTRMPCETFQLLIGKGINAEFPSNKPNRIKKLFPCCSSRKHRVDHRYTCDFVFIITLYWSFSDLPVASSRISRVLARCKVIMRLFYLTEQVSMLNLKSERKKKNKKNMKNK